MNLLELYRLVDDKINSCISDYREHKSLDIIESDVRDLLTIYRQNELFETFNVVFEQDAFEEIAAKSTYEKDIRLGLSLLKESANISEANNCLKTPWRILATIKRIKNRPMTIHIR